MSDGTEFIKNTLRVEYAKSFVIYFPEEFDILMESPNEDLEVAIDVSKFDDFVIAYGYATYLNEDGEECFYDVLPDRGTPEWTHYLTLRNKVKHEMSQASQYGLHGEPPFRLDFIGNKSYVIRSLGSMARVTSTVMAANMKALCDRNQKENKKMHQYLLENSSRLPIALQGSIRAHEALFNMAVASAATSMTQYMQFVQEDYQEAIETLRIQDQPKQLGNG